MCMAVILPSCAKDIGFEGGALAEATVGKQYEQNIAADGIEGLSYTAEQLPEGLVLSSDGTLAGVPEKRGVLRSPLRLPARDIPTPGQILL